MSQYHKLSDFENARFLQICLVFYIGFALVRWYPHHDNGQSDNVAVLVWSVTCCGLIVLDSQIM